MVISSQGGVRGMPSIAAYSAAKGALERWAESLAGEIAPFGLGVTVVVAGTFDTDIITDAGTSDHRDFEGPYAVHHPNIDRRGRLAMRILASPRSASLVGSRSCSTSARRLPAVPSASMPGCCWLPIGCFPVRLSIG
ncbi:short chain dehydrogenase family protein [Mycobacterium xenopi 3993]|nr:short chain dehydrogenase family protein [Mycobacterium xenopi 3993]